MTNATTLVEFLRARLEDVTADAIELDKALSRWQRERELNGPDGTQGSILASLLTPGSALHPDIILADVEAKRRIMAIHADYDAVEDIYMGHECIDDTNGLIRWYQADCPTLRLLALPFAAHPDFDPSWRPAEVTA